MVMEPKYFAFRRWLYTPIILWRSVIGSLGICIITYTYYTYNQFISTQFPRFFLSGFPNLRRWAFPKKWPDIHHLPLHTFPPKKPDFFLAPSLGTRFIFVDFKRWKKKRRGFSGLQTKKSSMNWSLLTFFNILWKVRAEINSFWQHIHHLKFKHGTWKCLWKKRKNI